MSTFGFGRNLPTPNTPNNTKDDNNITGKFDPTALERGAKALKMLDSSPNSQKAFELTKLQEITKQNELQFQIEQLRLKQSEVSTRKAQVESDERKKLLSHQQEQERITAQYKTKLEDELYQKKLYDQKKQNEEWLKQQHQQFLKQEQIRINNEKEIMNIKKEGLIKEKELEKEIEVAKVRQQNLGKIQQERDNFDIHLKMMKERSNEERITKMESLTFVFNSLGNGVYTLLNDKQRLTYTGLTLSGIALGIYGAKNGTKIMRKFIEQKIGKPSLVRETSRSFVNNNLFKNMYYYFNKSSKSKDLILNDIVLNENLNQRLDWLVNSILKSKENKTPYRNILLYGPPGTGKTLFAKTLALKSGMDYAIMTGGDIGPLREEAVTELNKLFNWSKNCKNGLILFIDECESFLKKRFINNNNTNNNGSGNNNMSEYLNNALSTFLYHTGSQNNNFCLILATNEKDLLDRAIIDRIDEFYNFNLPEELERYKLLKLYFQQYIINNINKININNTNKKKNNKNIEIDKLINDNYFKELAKKTNKLSGRQISKLCISIQSAIYGSGASKLTIDLLNTIIDWYLANNLNVSASTSSGNVDNDSS